jgi:hypothetical protein
VKKKRSARIVAAFAALAFLLPEMETGSLLSERKRRRKREREKERKRVVLSAPKERTKSVASERSLRKIFRLAFALSSFLLLSLSLSLSFSSLEARTRSTTYVSSLSLLLLLPLPLLLLLFLLLF